MDQITKSLRILNRNVTAASVGPFRIMLSTARYGPIFGRKIDPRIALKLFQSGAVFIYPAKS